MDVRGPHWVTIKKIQEHTSRAICRERVWSWAQTVEVIFSVRIRLELPSQVVVGLVVWILEVVFPVRGCLPDVNHSSCDPFFRVEIRDFAMHQGDMPVRRWVQDDALAVFAEWGSRAPKWAKDCGGCGDLIGLDSMLMCDLVDKTAMRLDLYLHIGRRTYDSNPITSDMRCPSFRTFVLICPMEFMKVTPSIHSSVLNSTSRVKS